MITRLGGIPLVSHMASTRGSHFILAWCQRVAGLLLVLFAWKHTYDLASGVSLAATGVGALLVWLMAVPLIFHVLNGGRLMLYESFGKRNDDLMVRWVLILSTMYLIVLGLVMVLSRQTVSPFLFWLSASLAGILLTYATGSRLGRTGNRTPWKLQRLSAAYMIPTVPGYVLCWYLNGSATGGTNMVMVTMQSMLGKLVLLLLLLCMIYHGSYGLLTIFSDFVTSRWKKAMVTVLIVLSAVITGVFGIKGIVVP